MSLKDEILKESRQTNVIEQILSELEEEDRSDLMELLNMRDVESTAIARGLRRRGFSVSERTVQRYRQKLEELNRG